jgi:hypothetical protein
MIRATFSRCPDVMNVVLFEDAALIKENQIESCPGVLGQIR